MLRQLSLIAAAGSLAGTPALAAGLQASHEVGAPRSGAVAGAYFSIPFGGARSGRAQAGLRLQMTHHFRDSMSPNAPVVRANAVDLRLTGDRNPTLYVAGRPVTGEEARKNNLVGGGIVSTAILVAAVVGAVVIYSALSGDNDDKCLDPALCD